MDHDLSDQNKMASFRRVNIILGVPSVFGAVDAIFHVNRINSYKAAKKTGCKLPILLQLLLQ